MNDYNQLAQVYRKTAEKPDKKYSILPTVMSLLGKLEGKRVLDLGCGSGFFTLPIARRHPVVVYGIDNSEEQLKLLPKHERIFPLKLDIFRDSLPESDVINAPYILNYASSTDELANLIEKCYDSLSGGGKMVALVDHIDLPIRRIRYPRKIREKRKAWGALKRFIGNPFQGASEIEIELFNSGESICKLQAFNHGDRTLYHLYMQAGFCKFAWHPPIISKKGLEKFGEDFWKDYGEYCELGYLVAKK